MVLCLKNYHIDIQEFYRLWDIILTRTHVLTANTIRVTSKLVRNRNVNDNNNNNVEICIQAWLLFFFFFLKIHE